MFRSSSSGFVEDPQFQQLLSVLSRELFGDAGSPPELDFVTIEQRAHEAGQRIARKLCEQFTSEQARTVQEPQPCPDCGRPCSGTIETRELLTRDGPIQLDEARHSCPRCRRVFFPQSTKPTLESSSI